MTSAAPVYFIRHGETDWNRAGRLQGRTETELNANGRRQAAVAAEALSGLVAPEVLARMPFYVSPMRRVRQTAEILRGHLALAAEDYQTEARLREIGFGAWEGRTWPEIRGRDPHGARARDADLWNHAPPGGESYADVTRRVAAFLATLSGPAVILAHGGVARALMVLFGAPQVPTLEAPIWQGRVLCLAPGDIAWHPATGHA